MSVRLDLVRAELEDPFVVTNGVNVFYLSGFESSNAALLVGRERARLFSDFRYAEAGRRVEGVEFVETRRSLLADLAERLDGRIAFEADDVTYAGWETLRGGGLELVPTRGVVEGLRAVKSEDELEAIRRAAAVTNAAFERLAEERFVGRTERELAWQMEVFLHELGADRLAFPPIVAAGANGATPHAEPGERTIQPGQSVVVDAGAAVGGYCSDCTRTFATGPLPDELAKAYRVCLEAQLEALDAVRPGASAKQVDGVARGRIDEAGLGKAFGHGLGHGVGLLVHEAPRLSPLSPDGETLEAGNVVTVEPGIYLSGVGGIRIEDLVVVGDDEGPEVLTSFTKDLVEVG